MPFIARYRKEATDGLDDIQLRELEARLGYLRELEDRRAAVLKSIDEQGKLTPELRAAIEAAPTKQELEDLYLPYKPKRRTKGMIAREAGLEPLADKLFADPTLEPLAEAAAFINADGRFCRCARRCSTACATSCPNAGPKTRRWCGKLREWLWAEGLFQSQLVDGKDGKHADVAKFRDYFDYAEPIRTRASHRALAVFRGRALECWTPSWCSTNRRRRQATQPGHAFVSLAEGRIARAPGLEPRPARGRRPDPQDASPGPGRSSCR